MYHQENMRFFRYVACFTEADIYQIQAKSRSLASNLNVFGRSRKGSQLI
jgi:hypothetical protein